MRRHSAGLLFAVAAALSASLAASAAAQVRSLQRTSTRVSLSQVTAPRIADPKLDAASIVISYVLQPPGATAHVTIGILQGSQRIATLFDGEQVGSDAPRVLNWDGHLPAGVRV